MDRSLFPPEQDPMLMRTLCVASDPLELVAPAMSRSIGKLRSPIYLVSED